MWNRTGWRRSLFLAVLLLLTSRPGTVSAVDDEECYRCHGLQGFTARNGDEVRQVAVSAEFFESSVHGILNCRECHADIAAIPHEAAATVVSCGQVCHQSDRSGNLYSHESLFWAYATSVHGKTREAKIPCTACHPHSSLAEIAKRDLHREVRQCASCHAAAEHVRDYFLDVHYRALAKGSRRAPSCPDCHTAHRILPESDSESSIHSSRLAATCSSGALSAGQEGRCHDTAQEGSFAGAGMNPLVLPGKRPGTSGWFFACAYWAILAALVFRAGVGLFRGR